MEQRTSGMGAGLPIQWSQIQHLWWFHGQLSLSSFCGLSECLPGIPGYLLKVTSLLLVALQPWNS